MNDDENNNNNNKDQEYDLESQTNLISIKVKTLTNMFKLTIPKKTKVLSFKQKIIKEYLKEQALGKRIRLIHAGKVLDDAKDISSYKLKENTCIHAALSDIVRTNNNNNNNNRNRQNNEGGDDDDEEEEEQNYRGFDRLRQGGTFSREDVEIIRSTFYQEVLEYERTQRRRPREDEAERYYRMEEEWISRQGPTSDFALNVATRRIRNNNNNSNDTEMDRIVRSFLQYQRIARGTNNSLDDHDDDDDNDILRRRDIIEGGGLTNRRDSNDDVNNNNDDNNNRTSRNRRHVEFLVGFFLGFFLGVIMLCFIWDENLSKYQRAGVVTGVGFNLYFQIGTNSNNTMNKKGNKNSKQSTVDGSIDENNDDAVYNIATIFH